GTGKYGTAGHDGWGVGDCRRRRGPRRGDRDLHVHAQCRAGVDVTPGGALTQEAFYLTRRASIPGIIRSRMIPGAYRIGPGRDKVARGLSACPPPRSLGSKRNGERLPAPSFSLAPSARPVDNGPVLIRPSLQGQADEPVPSRRGIP